MSLETAPSANQAAVMAMQVYAVLSHAPRDTAIGPEHLCLGRSDEVVVGHPAATMAHALKRVSLGHGPQNFGAHARAHGGARRCQSNERRGAAALERRDFDVLGRDARAS